MVNAASARDGVSLLELIEKKRQAIETVRLIYADSAYHRNELRSILEHQYGIHLNIVSAPRLGIWAHKDHIGQTLEYLRTQQGFRVQPRRWVVERSFAWIYKQRRLSKDYEYLPEVSESCLYTAMAITTLKKITRKNVKMGF